MCDYEMYHLWAFFCCCLKVRKEVMTVKWNALIDVKKHIIWKNFSLKSKPETQFPRRKKCTIEIWFIKILKQNCKSIYLISTFRTFLRRSLFVNLNKHKSIDIFIWILYSIHGRNLIVMIICSMVYWIKYKH